MEVRLLDSGLRHPPWLDSGHVSPPLRDSRGHKQADLVLIPPGAPSSRLVESRRQDAAGVIVQVTPRDRMLVTSPDSVDTLRQGDVLRNSSGTESKIDAR